MTSFLFWLPGICVALHIIEEFVWPGGFLAWHRRYRPEFAASITSRHAIVYNAILLAVTFVLGWMGPAWPRGLSLWLILTALLAFNGLFHAVGVLRLRQYSPGVVTGLILYVPLCVWGFWYFIQKNQASLLMAITSLILGLLYNVYSYLNHRRRAKPAT